PDGGAPRNLTRDFYESANSGASSMAWAPDGNALYFSSGVGLYTHIFSVSVGGGEVTQVTRESRNYNAFDISGRPAVANSPAPNPQDAASAQSWKIAYTVNDSFTADDIWAAPLKNVEQAKKITWVNPQIRDFALGKTRVIKWKGPDNLDVEGLLTLPLGYEEGKRYPLILQPGTEEVNRYPLTPHIHGGTSGRFTDTFNSRSQLWAANGYVVLMPNPRGSTGYGIHFTTANVGDWGGKDFKDLMAGVDTVIARGIADPDKLVVMGGSYGGVLAFCAIIPTARLTNPTRHNATPAWDTIARPRD